MGALELMLWSPLIAAPVCGLLFWLAVCRLRLDFAQAFDDLAGHLFLWLTIGFFAGIAIPVVLLFLYASSLAPVLVIISVPLGLSIGAVIATIEWRIFAGT